MNREGTKSVILRYVQKIDESDRLRSSVIDLRFQSGEFMLKVIPLLVNLDRLTILSKVMGTYLERGFNALLLHCVLKNCLNLQHLKCLGVPFTGEIFGEMCRSSIILNL